MLQPSDEHWHASTKQAHWNESFYFNAFDTDAGWACAVRVGVSPNAGTRDGFICLYLPDHATGFIRMSQSLGDDRAVIAVGGIELHCAEPFGGWRISYDGPIHHYQRAASSGDILRTLDTRVPTKHFALELEVEGSSPAVDYDDRSVRMRPVGEMLRFGKRSAPFRTLRRTLRALGALPAMMAAHHYEQSMTVRGTVTVDGERHLIAGHGQRDHSWGVRDMGVPVSWRWVSCQFGDDLCFNATQVDVLGMRVQSGFVQQGGDTEALDSWGYEARHDTSPYWPDSMDLWLKTKSGRRLALEAEVTTPLPVIADPDSRDVLVTAARAKYRWGGRVADGMVEFMERLS
jgi:hypothetical protein